MEQGGCLYVQEEEEVWETDSETSEADASEADASDSYESFVERLAAEIQSEQAAALEEGARRLLDMDFGEGDESEFSPFEDVASTEGGEEEPEKPKVDVSKPLVEPLFALPCGFQFSECAICYEAIDMVNVTVTTCGHTFHSSCAFKALEHADCCPMCRHQLIDEPVEDEDEEGSEEGSEDQEDDEDHEDQEEEEDSRPTMEQLATKLQNMGYTPVDFLTLFMRNILKRQDATRQSEDFLETLNDKIDDIVDGKITMAHVDQRTYAQVASQIKDLVRQGQPQEQQAV